MFAKALSEDARTPTGLLPASALPAATPSDRVSRPATIVISGSATLLAYRPAPAAWYIWATSVEKVVNAARNPTPRTIRVRPSGCTPIRSPSSRDPTTFTASVT